MLHCPVRMLVSTVLARTVYNKHLDTTSVKGMCSTGFVNHTFVIPVSIGLYLAIILTFLRI
jgi:hypothetical protein